MTEDEFWTLVEGARRDGGGVLADQVQLLREFFLERGSTEVLLAFRDRWDEVEERVFTWPICDAACVLLGYVSDDFFSDVRAWIVSHGRAFVDRVAADPDALVELADDLEALHTGDAEALGMLVWEVWEELTGDCGGELPSDGAPSQGPIGDRVDLGDQEAVRQRFPRLAEFVGLAGGSR